MKRVLTVLLVTAASLAAQDAEKSKPILEIGKRSEAYLSRIAALAFSADGARIASSAYDGSVAMWDVKTGKEIRKLVEPQGFRPDGFDGSGKVYEALAFTPDGALIAAAGFKIGIRGWDAEGKEILKIEDATEPIALSPDAQILAAKGEDNEIVLIDLKTRKKAGTLAGHTQWPGSLAFSPDGARLASTSHDGTWRVWDVAKREQVKATGDPIPEGMIGPTFPHHVRFSGDRRHLAVSFHGCWQLGLEIYDAKTLAKVAAIDVAHSDAIAFSPDGKLLAYQKAEDGVGLWDVDKKSERAVCAMPYKARLFAVAFCPDGKRLAAAGDGGTVIVWEVGQ